MNLQRTNVRDQTGMLLLTQLSSGCWSVRNLDGDRVGYYLTRGDATDDLQAAGYRCTDQGFFGQLGQPLDGSRWEKSEPLDLRQGMCDQGAHARCADADNTCACRCHEGSPRRC